MIQELLNISQPFAHTPDLIQGSGGNTSVKHKGRMLIKASGYRLCDMTENAGFVAVDATAVKQYFEKKLFIGADNADSHLKAYTISHILDADKTRLPSMETGFHSVLLKYVVHTHSVYTNLVNCAADSQRLLKDIFGDNTPAWIPFHNPGFYLSNSIYELVHASESCPKIIFLENHGLITTSDDIDEAVQLNAEVNNKIKNYFKIDEYPAVSIEQYADNTFISRTGSLADWMRTFDLSSAFFEQTLFPDQTVFFKGQIHIGDTPNPSRKINIDPQSFAITYYTNEKEALAIDETLAAFFFILYHLKQAGLDPKFIPADHVDYINNMDMERYRKSLME